MGMHEGALGLALHRQCEHSHAILLTGSEVLRTFW